MVILKAPVTADRMPAPTTVPVELREAAASKGRLSGADGVRAIAALLVIFHHCFQKLASWEQTAWLQDVHGFFIKGATGVSIFFVLSGMLLSYPFWTAYFAKKPYPSIGHYFKRRAQRILPGFYVALGVSFVVADILARHDGYVVRDAAYRLRAGFTFTSEFTYTTLFPTDVNGPLWSIGFEVFCYFLMPLLMLGLFLVKFRGRIAGWTYWLLAVGAVLLLNQWVITMFATNAIGKGWEYGLIGGAKSWMPGYNPVGFFAHFAMGILAAGFIAMWNVYMAGRKNWYFDLVALAAFSGMMGIFWWKRTPAELDGTFSMQQNPYFYPVFPLLAGVLLAALAYSKVLGRMFDSPFLRYTAKISFGLYIWHHLVILWVGRVVEPSFLPYGGVSDPLRWLEISLLAIVISYIVATLSWHIIERPFLEGFLSGRRKKKAIAPTG
jgi:peptidoglycan/LPS O-acetylase OafA/YrhL